MFLYNHSSADHEVPELQGQGCLDRQLGSFPPLAEAILLTQLESQEDRRRQTNGYPRGLRVRKSWCK